MISGVKNVSLMKPIPENNFFLWWYSVRSTCLVVPGRWRLQGTAGLAACELGVPGSSHGSMLLILGDEDTLLSVLKGNAL